MHLKDQTKYLNNNLEKMSSTDWIQELKVVELKEELKKRDQPIAGKKAELAARLEEYVKEHEAGAAEGAAVEAETAAEKEDLAAEEASVPAQEEAALEKEGEAAEEPALKAGPGGEAEAAVAPAEAKALAADDFNLDYGESDDEQPQKQEAKPAEKPAERPAAAAQPSSKPERKDQEEEMKEPESRKRPTSEIPPSEEASRPEKQAKTEQYLSKPKQPAGADAPAVAIAAEKPEQQQERKPGSRALLIEGFVRPFTENQARTLLGQSGTVVAMWMPSIRNLAWVVYSTISEAQAAKTALFKLQWPAGSPKVLMPRSVSIRAAEKAIGHGKGDENFKIDRSEEDGPDEPEIENTRSKAMDIEGAITIPAGHPSTSHQQQQHATADDEEILKDASPLRVKDLRELLSRKSTGSARAAERKRRDPGPNLDELFRKTIAKPSIYWLPLSEEAVELKKKAKAATGSAGGNGSG